MGISCVIYGKGKRLLLKSNNQIKGETHTKKMLMSLILGGALACSIALPAAAAQKTDDTHAETPRGEASVSLPDSVLYYGKIETISRKEDGEMTALHMSSDRYGEYVMHLSEDTVWIDSGNRTASDPATLKEGEGLYVFHSPVSTRSLPPQSAAFAVVRNVPQDASCAHYHEVEAIEETDGTLRITTGNGGLFLLADKETSLSSYEGTAPAGLGEIEAGTHIMAWYGPVALSYPGQAHASHIMILNQGEQSLARVDLAVLLHAAQGSPVVNYAMRFSDVAQDAPDAEAIRWVASEGLMSGYDDGSRFGPDDPVTREQLVVILWRQSGSPMLMDYPGLTKYSDVGDISRFAQPAMAWAHQKGLVPAEGRLGPKDTVTATEVEQMMEALNK